MQAQKNDGTWEDCGCPLGMGPKQFPGGVAVLPRPHACMLSKDEYCKHYICDQHAYNKLGSASKATPLGKWVAQRLKERRLFVVKQPFRAPLPPQPWHSDEPSSQDVPLIPGWRAWAPINKELQIDAERPQDYDDQILDLFDRIGVQEAWRQEEMRDSAEAWILACGEDPTSKITRSVLLKVDRVFVTANMEFHTLMTRVWAKIGTLTRTLKLGQKMGHLRQVVDIRIDAEVHVWGCDHVFNF